MGNHLNKFKNRKFGRLVLCSFFGITGIATFAILSSSSCSYQHGKINYEIISEQNHTCQVASVSKNFEAKNLKIPDEVGINNEKYRVTKIANGVFWNNHNIYGKLTLPNYLTDLEESAFWGCENITGKLVLPSTLTTIKKSVFLGCDHISGELVIPNSVTEVDESAFFDCQSLTSVVCGTGLTTLKDSVFYGCKKLATADLGGIVKIGKSTFLYCTNLTSWQTTGRLTEIGEAAFQKCAKLESMRFGEWDNSSGTIGTKAFFECKDGGTIYGNNRADFLLSAKDSFLPEGWTIANSITI